MLTEACSPNQIKNESNSNGLGDLVLSFWLINQKTVRRFLTGVFGEVRFLFMHEWDALGGERSSLAKNGAVTSAFRS